MKLIIRIVLFLSISLNGYFIFDEIKFYQIEEMEKSFSKGMSSGSDKTNWNQGFEIFSKKVLQKDKELLAKKYYYINIWATWCKPCVKEMPWLDSLASCLQKDVGYFFLTDMKDSAVNECKTVKNYKIKNFVFLNDMNDFVTAICNQQGVKTKAYPMTVILTHKGELLHYSIGAYSNKREAIDFLELINDLE